MASLTTATPLLLLGLLLSLALLYDLRRRTRDTDEDADDAHTCNGFGFGQLVID